MLLIGEVNHLTAQFSSKRDPGAIPAARDAGTAGNEELLFRRGTAPKIRRGFGRAGALDLSIDVPKTAVHGDHAELVLEADGIQMSHVRPQILRPATLRFADAIQVRLAQRHLMRCIRRRSA